MPSQQKFDQTLRISKFYNAQEALFYNFRKCYQYALSSELIVPLDQLICLIINIFSQVEKNIPWRWSKECYPFLYLPDYQRQNIKKTLSMINFEDFEVNAHHPHPHTESHSEPACQPLSLDHILTPHQTTHSLHDTNIEEIDDHYSSIQHSANILDHIYRSEEALAGEADHYDTAHYDQEQSKLRKRMERRMKNETKNIPKNFGKGIISFIERNDQKVRSLLAKNNVNYHDFLQRMRVQKKIINTIADLRRLWTDPLIGRCMRIISNIFFRRYALNYIFNSRISNYSSHVKYRQSLWQALRNPESFNRIKQY